MNDKLYYWQVSSVHRYLADGVVLAKNKDEALEKVSKIYSDVYLKVEIDEDSGADLEEHEEVKGLYIRWED